MLIFWSGQGQHSAVFSAADVCILLGGVVGQVPRGVAGIDAVAASRHVLSSIEGRGVFVCVCVCQGDVEINGNKNHISQWHRQFARSLEESYQNVQVDPGIQGHVCF